jgi:D-glycero-D-manno-heptose 1,7-bisphosphate phosphatase
MGIGAVRTAVFLDRDGVLNHTIVRRGIPHPPDDVAACVLLPGVRQACQLLTSAGYVLLVVTNQPDVARGRQCRARVERINAWLQYTLPIQQVLTCYHDTADRCVCRKPKPGLLLQAAQRWGITLPQSFMVGDRWSDVEAGRAAGCTGVLIERAYSERDRCQPAWVARDLLAAVDIIMTGRNTA